MDKSINLNNFSPVSVVEWKEHISRGLKDGQNINDFKYLIGDCIEMDPFVGFDTHKSYVPLDTRIPKSCIRIPLSSNTNKIALQVLNFGIESILINIDQTVDFESLFNGIDLSAISLYLMVEDSMVKDDLNRYLSDRYVGISIDVHYIPSSSNTQIITLDWCDRWKEMKHTLTSFNVESNDHYIITTCKDEFLVQVAELRAVRKVWQNNANNTQCTLHQMVFIPLESVEDIHPLIPINYRIMSAYLGGADVIFFDYVEDIELIRLTANIHHILREESRFTIVKDPMVGSYVIEDICLKIESTLI
ncbi:MAG: methylmalonyl-CoA mutase family protein [Saprospiraceae bacterium]